MRYTFHVLLLMLFASSFAAAQTVTDSTRRVENARRRPVFIDQNGDGVADGIQGTGNREKRRLDRFIDLNGDGICDTREQGLGFRRQMAGAGKKGGQQGQGRGR